jgi:hypothetical protein
MLNQAFIVELKHEAASTKRILERVPQGNFDWKPHEKSMTLGRLASHVAELPGFLNSILKMDEFDFAKGHYKPSLAKTPEQLMNFFQQKLDEVVQTLQNTSDEKMHATFTLRSGDQVFAAIPYGSRSFNGPEPYHTPPGPDGCLPSLAGHSGSRSVWSKCG